MSIIARLVPLPALTVAAALVVAAEPAAPPLRQQVIDAERAFARSMAERDHAAFVRHLSEQAIFQSPGGPLRGKAAVAAAWQPYYEGAAAPFSWEPDQVEVLPDGTLAHSSGPVRDPAGKQFARFYSVWRQEAPGVWRIVFDTGGPPNAQDRAREAAAPASGAAPAK